MKDYKRIVLGVTATALLIGAGVATWVGARPQASSPTPATSVAPVWDVLYAQRFELETPFTHWYRAEAPQFDRGTILVLEVDPQLVVPRQSFEPVLYVGAQTAERVNQGDVSGRVIAIVPGAELDLEETPIWFGSPELPERVDAARVTSERELAVAAGIEGVPAARVADARLLGGPVFRAVDRGDLNPHLAQLVERFSPVEQDLIRGLSAERITR